MADAQKPAASDDAKTAPKKRSRFRKWLIVVGVAMLALSITFGAGWIVGRRGMGELEERAERAALLEARRRLAQAEVAVGEQNFGIAEGHVRAAAQQLDETEPEGGLAQLAAEIAQVRIGVTSDIPEQQRKLRELVARFDRELDPPGSPTTATPAQ